ncbi:MAG: hypothetical protein ACTHK0_03530 [Ginsengibacter sp.]
MLPVLTDKRNVLRGDTNMVVDSQMGQSSYSETESSLKRYCKRLSAAAVRVHG